MTIGASHGVDIVRTLPVIIGGIHGLHLQPATGYSGMTGLTGIPGIIGMSLVTGCATDPLMHSGGGSVIFRTRFMCPVGGMALHAYALDRII